MGARLAQGPEAGLCIMHNEKVTKTRAFALANSATVFQAEVHAIRMATIYIRENIPKKERVHIMCAGIASSRSIS